ncbi:hypothetical protein LPB138_09740 [Urechidicola croceus]|uniref:P/Homo B domain-containing protein n=1 Tax=Urechidicola croceus TaxID=1850246 RepID=A0A1D8P8N1_9FLAO|nr:hypothetical protein LPB138_09740 [Urechidicola croceus]
MTLFSQNERNFWKQLDSSEGLQQTLEKASSPRNHSALSLDLNGLTNALLNAPKRGEFVGNSNLIIQFPNAKGELKSYRVSEASIFAPELAAKYPEIKSYVGQGVEDPTAVIRFSVSPYNGLHTMVLSGKQKSEFIKPFDDNFESYIVYSRSDDEFRNSTFECLTEDFGADPKQRFSDNSTYRDADDQILRTYRLAVSTTGEYTAYHGGTVADALAAINTTMTRVNGIYEREFAVTMVLIGNTDTVIYEDASSDPYTGSFNSELQNTLTAEIEEANYDIGHLFHQESNSNGNAGCIGCVCVDGSKGSAFTSHVTPEGDDFDVDFVAHEMGHQFGGNHTWTFNGSEGTGVQMEPGSGSTIMGYAGITGASDVQPHSDDYFLFSNIEQITTYIASTTCQVETDLTNAVPTADAGSDYTIPAGTAFVLEGAGSDADAADVLTYCWEQADVGFSATTSVSSTNTGGPNFRSLPPTTETDRYMPELATVLGGSLSSQWETVSDVSRIMNFALTVRDNAAGGAQNAIDMMQVTVDDTAGPFIVTSQTASEVWDAGTSKTITWDVAGTDGGSINASTVDIFVTPDAGATMIEVATGVANNGSYNITVPIGAVTTEGKIIVKASDNIFYAVNSANITIQESEFIMNFTEPSVDVCSPNDAVYEFTYNTFLGFTDMVTFSATGNPTGTTVTFNPTTASVDGETVEVTVSGITDANVGESVINILGTSSVNKDTDITLNVYSATFETSSLVSPADGAVDLIGPYMLEWDVDVNATSYDVEVATDAAFSTIVESATVTTTSYEATMLDIETEYFWRITPSNDCGTGTASDAFSFTTANIVCDSFGSSDVPVSISTVPVIITSVLSITDGVEITDVDVQVDVTHTWDNDLIITITSPYGTSVTLTDTNGSNGDNYSNTIFDDEAETSITAGSPPYAGSFIPEQALSAFDGEPSFGEWTLTIEDVANGDGGSLNSWTVFTCGSPIEDLDGDGVLDSDDNCPSVANADQADNDGDGIGDVCDDDDDDDTVLDIDDNCPLTANTNQLDTDGDGLGDVCDDDDDDDTVLDINDNCPLTANTDQSDLDNDGEGDVCDNDIDGDNVPNLVDNCLLVSNSSQGDNDNDGLGDACDDDDDNDGVIDAQDNCPLTPNPDQSDVDRDGLGDVCEDCDGDGIVNYYDEDTCDIQVIEGFSPNNDGVNDLWVIENIDLYLNNTVKVFNRWGNLVFTAQGYKNTWDGVATEGGSGDKLPAGAYLYFVDANEPGIEPVQGWVYINY